MVFRVAAGCGRAPRRDNRSSLQTRKTASSRSSTAGLLTVARCGIASGSLRTGHRRDSSLVAPIPTTSAATPTIPPAAPRWSLRRWINLRRNPTRTSTRFGRRAPGAFRSRVTAIKSPTSDCCPSSCANCRGDDVRGHIPNATPSHTPTPPKTRKNGSMTPGGCPRTALHPRRRGRMAGGGREARRVPVAEALWGSRLTPAEGAVLLPVRSPVSSPPAVGWGRR
jgi:hypothetical protein